ncbi:hypothetical protein WJX72_003126 [[Myrmecia] bisecta]|uniref:Iron-sulfur cluster assembly protein SufB n=1 Tax=[Myrmecia] bisecta TaxID=41462 RepID=A0AAW1Q0N0_9CHLO
MVADPAAKEKRDLQAYLSKPYKHGWKTILESDTFPKGLGIEVVKAISAKKNEPQWMLDFRLRAFSQWLKLTEPAWSDCDFPAFDYQNISYYSAPKAKEAKASLDEVDPEGPPGAGQEAPGQRGACG